MRFHILSLMLALISTAAPAMVEVGRLTVEHRSEPINIESTAPRLSWVITSDSDNVMQTAYRVQVASSPEKLAAGIADLWDSDSVASDRSVLVPYQGQRLKPNQQCFWRVKAYTTRGETPWSDTSLWAMGLMGESHWSGRWIGHDAPFPWDVEDEHSRLSARYLRKEMALQPKEVRRATVHVCGLGLYELFINGCRVGDDVLTPSPTDYRRTVTYNTYDVTQLLQAADSAVAVGAVVGNGRYYTMQQNKKKYKINNFGYPTLRLNLIIEYADGTKQRVATDESWRLTAQGPIRSNNEYDGEIYDARMELTGWTLPGYDDSAWMPAERSAIPYGTLRANTAPQMKVMMMLAPRDVTRSDNGRLLVDFGQNTAGWVKLRLKNHNEGDTVMIRYAEILTPDSAHIATENLRHAQSTDLYIANGEEDGTWWSPRFSYHGFRYAEISGIDHLDPVDVMAEVVYDDVADNGTFACSVPLLNDIHRNALWGITSNYKGMPVDCPQRDERQPWTGDHAMGSWGESFLTDNVCLYSKWMDDIREAQREDGCIPDVCPAFWNYYTPDMTWSSALPIACDMIYRQTGDSLPIARCYPAMRRWMRFIRDNYSTDDGLIRADKYGDWCTPPEDRTQIHTKDPARLTDGTLIASAYYYKMCHLMADFARMLDLAAEADDWLDMAEPLKTAFNQRFLTVKKGTSKASKPHILYPDSVFYGNNTATANLLPLTFDMVPEKYREDVASNLITTIMTTNGGHVASGVVGLNWLMRQLSRMGRGDVAMLLASNRTYPSYGYMIDHGATTIWELWNGDTASRAMNSGNHVMLLGDLLAWYYRDLAGFNPLMPGYKSIALKPDFSIPDLSEVDASYDTPYGRLGSHWRKTPMRLHWEVEVPCNTTAFVYLPTTDSLQVGGLRLVDITDGVSICEVGSGHHVFEIDIDPGADEGRTPIVVDEFLYESTSFPECHASTIFEEPDGSLVAAFFGGTKERNPDCCIWVCRKEKGADHWSQPVIAADGVFAADDPYRHLAGLSGIADDTTPASAGPVRADFAGDVATARRKACWNPVLYRIPGDDELLLFYKIGTNVADWTGWLTRSADGGRTWSQREPLPEGILGPIKNKPEYIDGRLLCPSSRESGGWRAWMEYTDDKGKSWHSTGPLPSDSGYMTVDHKRLQPYFSIQPSILRLADGSLKILCRSRNSYLTSACSSDNGSTWSTMSLTDIPNNNSGTDAVTLRDGRHLLVYNDFSTIDGTPKGPRTPLCVAISDDDGATWRNIATLEDSPISQYSYPCVIEGADGTIHILYTWRRQRIRHIALDLSRLPPSDPQHCSRREKK